MRGRIIESEIRKEFNTERLGNAGNSLSKWHWRDNQLLLNGRLRDFFVIQRCQRWVLWSEVTGQPSPHWDTWVAQRLALLPDSARDPGSIPGLGHRLCRVCMFSPRLRGFPPGAPVPPTLQKTCWLGALAQTGARM